MSRRPPKDSLPHQVPFRFVAQGLLGPTFGATLGSGEGQEGSVGLAFLTEALAQAILLVDPPEQTSRLRLVGLDHVVLRQEVFAGDRVFIQVERQGRFGRLSRYHCRMLKGGCVVLEGRITVAH